MRIKLLSIFSIILVLFIAGCESKPQKAQEIKENSSKAKEEVLKADSYTLTTTTGDKITFEVANGVMLSKQLNGKMVLINFWATWCKPCIKEMPTFAQLQEKYKDNFIIIGVLFEEDKDVEELAAFMKKHKVNFPVTVGPENFVLARAFGNIKMIPESFLYTKEGFFVEKFIGEISKTKLENYITQDMNTK